MNKFLTASSRIVIAWAIIGAAAFVVGALAGFTWRCLSFGFGLTS